jgi:hypothetical protein
VWYEVTACSHYRRLLVAPAARKITIAVTVEETAVWWHSAAAKADPETYSADVATAAMVGVAASVVIHAETDSTASNNAAEVGRLVAGQIHSLASAPH